MDSPGFESRLGQEIFLSSKMSRFDPIRWVLGSFLGVIRPECEVDKSLPLLARLRMSETIVEE